MKSTNQSPSQLNRTTSARRGTYFGMYTKTAVEDLGRGIGLLAHRQRRQEYGGYGRKARSRLSGR